MSGMYGSDYPEPFDPGPEDNPAIEPADAAVEQELQWNRDVAREAHRLRVRNEASRRVHQEQQATGTAFDMGTLAELLARPPEPPTRVEGLLPSRASMLLVAARKTGKTTMLANLARCLLTGEDFLGRFPVRPVAGSVALLNYEVSGTVVARWADECGVPRDRLTIVNLRGRRNPLSHPEDRAALAKHLAAIGTEVLMVDPFGRAFTGESQDNAGQTTAFLTDLDTFARAEVGATELVLSAHAGWNGERTRGSSALEDWADTNVWLTRDPEDESQRFLKAEGRDIDVAEDRLDYHPATRLLTMSGAGSRRQAKDARKQSQLGVLAVRAAREQPGVGTVEMEAAVRKMEDAPGFRKGDVTKAAKEAVTLGWLRTEGGGPGLKTAWYSTDSPTVPDRPRTLPGDSPRTLPTLPYRGRVGEGEGQEASPEQKPGDGSQAPTAALSLTVVPS